MNVMYFLKRTDDADAGEPAEAAVPGKEAELGMYRIHAFFPNTLFIYI